MKEYHKIQTVFKRDPENKMKTLLIGEYSIPEFEYLAMNNWTFTEKINGTNIRIMWDTKELTFGGKTETAQIPATLINRLNDLFKKEMFEKMFPEGCCLYGEGYGSKIQKGGGNYIKDGQDFILFDVKIGEWWLKRFDVDSIACDLNIKLVPMIGHGTIKDMVDKCKEGFSSVFGEFKAEGIVARPSTELFARNGKRIITKIKCKDFIKKT